ncbi:MAG: putative secreted protein [Herbinix sp.]|nr:putative secreted protein [Herbinix sp.]
MVGQLLLYQRIVRILKDKYVLKPEVEELLNADRNEYDRLYGADDAYWMLQNNVMQDQWLEETDPLMKSLRDWTIP